MNPDLITTAFTLANSVRVLFYLPQIVAVARSVDGARDIALSTWWMWAATNLLGTAYGVVVAADVMLASSFGASAAACLLTIALTLAKRLRHGRGPARSTLARGVCP